MTEVIFITGSGCHGASYDAINLEQQSQLQGRLQQMFRANEYDEKTGILTIPTERAKAFESVLAHYSEVFLNGRLFLLVGVGSRGKPAGHKYFLHE